jgi:hypothetical protein
MNKIGTGTVGNLETFRQATDPMFKGDSPVPIFDWKLRPGAKAVFVTAAQNATPVNKDWWRVIQTLCGHYGCDLAVIPIRYKNPTSAWKGSQENSEHWVSEVKPYLASVRAKLNANVMLLGDIKIQPTAADPLTGFEAVAGALSGIVGHTKIQTRSIATPQNRMAKILMTSGACTEHNYSDTRAGRVGDFHHSLSGVLVELDGKRFYARRIHFDTKTRSATDAARRLRFHANGKVQTAPRAAGLITGDLHEWFADPKAVAATWGAGGMIEVAEPRHVVYHDAADGYSIMHHHKGDPFTAYAKWLSGRNIVRAELESLRDFIASRVRPGVQNVLVASNHNDFFTRFIREHDWRTDPANAEWYLETALHMVQNTKFVKGYGTKYPDAFTYWMRKFNIPQTTVLDHKQSFKIREVECSLHGDDGPNGSRGSIKNLRRIGVKTAIGHSHSPGEDEGATQVGSFWGDDGADYTGPVSSWLQANCFINDDGKRQLSFIIDGHYHN